MHALAILASLALAACGGGTATPNPAAATGSTTQAPASSSGPPAATASPEVTQMPSGPFTLRSDAFAEGGAIPREYSCQGADISPALAWTGTPAGTAELVLVVDDPDANGFVHWIAIIGGTEVALPRAIAPTSQSVRQGINGFGDVGWGGPCPPSGTHHYRFTLTAAAQATGLTAEPTISEVRGALSKASVLGTAVLAGTYRKT